MKELIDVYIQRRNEIQMSAEDLGADTAARCWAELGVANRHIERVLDGMLRLEQVVPEIEACFVRTQKLLGLK